MSSHDLKVKNIKPVCMHVCVDVWVLCVHACMCGCVGVVCACMYVWV